MSTSLEDGSTAGVTRGVTDGGAGGNNPKGTNALSKGVFSSCLFIE